MEPRTTPGSRAELAGDSRPGFQALRAFSYSTSASAMVASPIDRTRWEAVTLARVRKLRWAVALGCSETAIPCSGPKDRSRAVWAIRQKRIPLGFCVPEIIAFGRHGRWHDDKARFIYTHLYTHACKRRHMYTYTYIRYYGYGRMLLTITTLVHVEPLHNL